MERNYKFNEQELCEIYANIIKVGWDDRLGKQPDYKKLDRWWEHYRDLKESIEEVIPSQVLRKEFMRENYEFYREVGYIDVDEDYETFFLNNGLRHVVERLDNYCGDSNNQGQPRTKTSPFQRLLFKLGISKKR